LAVSSLEGSWVTFRAARSLLDTASGTGLVSTTAGKAKVNVLARCELCNFGGFVTIKQIKVQHLFSIRPPRIAFLSFRCVALDPCETLTASLLSTIIVRDIFQSEWGRAMRYVAPALLLFAFSVLPAGASDLMTQVGTWACSSTCSQITFNPPFSAPPTVILSVTRIDPGPGDPDNNQAPAITSFNYTATN
jgi:hypothetical protein